MAEKARGYVYFIEAKGMGLIKIGWTANDVGGRLGDLACASPAELVVLGLREGAMAAERQLHRDFAEHRVRGEWFRDCPAIRDYIREHTHDWEPVLREKRMALAVDWSGLQPKHFPDHVYLPGELCRCAVCGRLAWAGPNLWRQCAHPLDDGTACNGGMVGMGEKPDRRRRKPYVCRDL
jgi:hypothetical protein